MLTLDLAIGSAVTVEVSNNGVDFYGDLYFAIIPRIAIGTLSPSSFYVQAGLDTVQPLKISGSSFKTANILDDADVFIQCHVGNAVWNASIINDYSLECPVNLAYFSANTTVNVYLSSFYSKSINASTTQMSEFKLGETERRPLSFIASPIIYSINTPGLPINVDAGNLSIIGEHLDIIDDIEIVGSNRLLTRTNIDSSSSPNLINLEILSPAADLSGSYNLSMILSSSQTSEVIQIYEPSFSILTPFVPSIHSLIPSHSTVASKVYIRNTDDSCPFNFSQTIYCKFVLETADSDGNMEVVDTNATWIGAHLIACLTPIVHPQTVNVSVSFDTVQYSNSLSLSIIPIPSITKILPTNTVYPSQYIKFTIIGSNFLSDESATITACQFSDKINGEVRLSDARIIDSNTLTCLKPDFVNSTSADYTIGVTFDGYSIYEIDDVLLEVSTVYSPPISTSINPQFGDDESGRSLNITGSYFRSGSTRCEYTIKLETYDDDSTHIQYSYTTDFAENITVHSDELITCFLPSYDEIIAQFNGEYIQHIRPKSRRRIFVRAINEFNESGNYETLWYEYRSTPLIYDVFPIQMFDDMANDIYVSGYNFISSPKLKCKLVNASNSATISIVSATFIDYQNIICTLPVMQPEIMQIAVTNNGIDYIYYSQSNVYLLAAPTITKLSPRIGNSIITQSIFVIGSNFEYPIVSGSNFIDGVICRFDGQYIVGNASIINATHLQCPLPPIKASIYLTDSYNATFEISFDAGTNYILSPDVFTFIPTQDAPNINAMYPWFGPRDVNTVIYIEGTSFDQGIYCKIGDHGVSQGTVLNDTLAACDSGIYDVNEITIVDVQVSRYLDHDFCCSDAFNFKYIPVLILSNLSPTVVFERSTLTMIENEDSSELAEIISVYGEYFYDSASIRCKFTYEDAEYVIGIATTIGLYQSSNSITCPTPYNRAVGTYNVSVSNDGINFVDGL